MPSSWLAFTPRDTVFVRDGRSFDAASDTFAQVVRPGPTTIAGAVSAAFSTDLNTNPDEVRGPVLARETTGGWEPYFPAPADLVITTDGSRRVFRLAHEPIKGSTDLDEDDSPDDGGQGWLLPPRHAEPAEPLTRCWIPGRTLARYLSGGFSGQRGVPLSDLNPLRAGHHLTEPLVRERRVGLAREDRRVRAGYLYQTEHLRPREGWSFLAEIDVPENWERSARGHCPFGGRGRLADVQPAVMRWPQADDSVVGKRVLVYLATPAIWVGGWRMPVPSGARLVAAATGEPEPAATAKREQGKAWRDSRALRWAVPAGSVYLLEFADAAAGAVWAKRWHGRALDRSLPLGERDLLRTAGFGVVLTGAWT